MSSNLECLVVEFKPNEWYYLLQSSFDSVYVFDWRENATTVGPFSSWETADDHMMKQYGNPGSLQLAPYEENSEPDEVLSERIGAALSPTKLKSGTWLL